MSIVFNVRVKSLIATERLDEEDREVPGDYAFDLPDAASAWPSEQQATAVLDQFHESVAIGVLEDFDISVFNAQGEEIFEE